MPTTHFRASQRRGEGGPRRAAEEDHISVATSWGVISCRVRGDMKLVFSFGEGKAEGDPTRRDLLGGKGAGLAEMTSLGLPVPPGFTISTDACRAFTAAGRMPEELVPAVEEALAKVEKQV